jgi:hypothetical protein
LLVVDFFFVGGGGGGGGCIPDTLEVVDVEGYAMVPDSCMNLYYLDLEGDDIPDYRLQFGPPWYEPGSGAERPEDGDYVYITGGLVDWVSPEMIIVYEINDLWWRDPVYPGGGHGGGHGGHHGPGHQGDRVRIHGSFPNPFNPETTLSFELPEPGEIHLAVYNLRGERVAELVNGYRDGGMHQVTWNASNLSSGIYIFRLEAGQTTSISKVVFTR